MSLEASVQRSGLDAAFSGQPSFLPLFQAPVFRQGSLTVYSSLGKRSTRSTSRAFWCAPEMDLKGHHDPFRDGVPVGIEGLAFGMIARATANCGVNHIFEMPTMKPTGVK